MNTTASYESNRAMLDKTGVKIADALDKLTDAINGEGGSSGSGGSDCPVMKVLVDVQANVPVQEQTTLTMNKTWNEIRNALIDGQFVFVAVNYEGSAVPESDTVNNPKTVSLTCYSEDANRYIVIVPGYGDFNAATPDDYPVCINGGK